VEVLYDEIFDFIDTFIDSHVLLEFQVRHEKLVRQHRDNMIITINTNIKEGLNKLSNFIKRYNNNISDIF
jgi:hypothetical protein